MQNNQLFQNQRNYQTKHFPSQKIILSKNGKISLSKSTRVTSQLSAKNQQINFLKSQVLQLKSKLEKQKAESKKISILSDEIRKVKQKLIDKVNEKNLRQRKNPEQLSDEAISQYFGSAQQQQRYDTQSQSHSKRPLENGQMKQSTYRIFRNFSIFNSASKKSQRQKTNGVQMKLIESQETPNHEQEEKIHVFGEETTANIKQDKNNIDRNKFKKNLGSFFEDKTVKNDYQSNKQAKKPFFYNQFQLQNFSNSRNNLEYTKKFSIVEYKKKMKK